MTERKIHLNITDDLINKNVNRKNLFNAIGYMSLWCVNGYDTLDIYPDNTIGNGSLIAWYHNQKDEKSYTMGAVLDSKTGEYSFHS